MVLACIGHWYTSLLYVAPVGAVVGFLRVQTIRDRRADAAAAAEADGAPAAWDDAPVGRSGLGNA